MAKYRVRLESPDHMRANGEPHFRVVHLAAGSADEARLICQRHEWQHASQSYPHVDELIDAESEAERTGTRMPSFARGQLAVHRQTVPYNIVAVEEVR